ncbi:hypothetical protein EX87_18840 (plasmid) [Brevibacillus laterosporus]|uniref:Uncharacterized protein n=1 Tax=Brevibacillus laterosporus TaxID=1465 RepID=A0A0F7EJM9_BRELA|nr:hypothetical protein EX87_18840 [Brevibacillus laterosporus]
MIQGMMIHYPVKREMVHLSFVDEIGQQVVNNPFYIHFMSFESWFAKKSFPTCKETTFVIKVRYQPSLHPQ